MVYREHTGIHHQLYAYTLQNARVTMRFLIRFSLLFSPSRCVSNNVILGRHHLYTYPPVYVYDIPSIIVIPVWRTNDSTRAKLGPLPRRRYIYVYIDRAGPENFSGETENYARRPRAMVSADRPTVRHGMSGVRHAGTARLYKRILGTCVNGGYTAVMRIRYVHARQTLGTGIRLAPVIADN